MKRERLSPLRTRGITKTVTMAALLVAGGLATLGVASASGASHSTSKHVVITVDKTAKYGTILVSGRTLYTLTPSAEKCAKTCLKYWTAVLLPKGTKSA